MNWVQKRAVVTLRREVFAVLDEQDRRFDAWLEWMGTEADRIRESRIGVDRIGQGVGLYRNTGFEDNQDRRT